jgi:UDP-3-O-[3-hydroxymyristoyl] glucosamine N-acyltransferase
MNIKEIINLVNGELKLPKNKSIAEIYDKIEITGINSLKYSTEKELSFFSNKKYFTNYLNTKSLVVCVEKKFFKEEFLTDKILILVDDIKKTIDLLIDKFYVEEKQESKICDTAIIDKSVILEKDVSVGEYSVIKQSTKICSGTKIGDLCYIGKNVTIGKGCKIFSSVKILDGTIIGDNVIIHSGAVIGSDGFGYITDKNNFHKKIKQVGIVEISSNVEIGANVCIDRATLGKTFIGEGTKIDNLVHIAHNVEIGKNCLIIAQVGIAGSSIIGDNVILAGQAGIADHIIVGDNSIVAAQAGVISDIEKNKIVSGFPARDHKEQMKLAAMLNRLLLKKKTK